MLKLLKLTLILAIVFELILGIPFFGWVAVTTTAWIPLIFMLILHITNIVLARKQHIPVPSGNKLGIVTSIFGFIPFVGMVLHIITAILLTANIKTVNFHRHEKRLRKLKNIKMQEKQYKKQLMEYIHKQYDIAVDTNFLMLFDELLLHILQRYSTKLYVSPITFQELEKLKTASDGQTIKRAQNAFDVIEEFQKHNRLYWTKNIKHGSSNDQRIVLSINEELKHGVKLVFASHDKGARIIARSLSIPVLGDLNVTKTS